MIHLPVLREADLDGEELQQFRTGPALLTYCPECVNVGWTPTTNEMGCKWGDHPEIKQYFNELDSEEHDENTVKCPGFTSRSLATPGEGAPATAAVAGMEKIIPGVVDEISDDDWFDLADEALGDISTQQPEDAVVLDRAMDELFKRDHKSTDDSEYKYNYGPEDEMTMRGVASTKRELHAFLRSAGLTKTMAQHQAKDIIVRSMLTWRGGMMSPYLGDNVINDIFSEFVAENG